MATRRKCSYSLRVFVVDEVKASQTPMQIPHFVQRSSSMTGADASSGNEMASTGHASAQRLHEAP